MVGLDYFLNKKWIKKSKKFLDNDRYIANVFKTINENINFSFGKHLANDRYLFDYAKAFSIPKEALAWSEIQILEVLSLLILDGNLEEKNPKKILKAIVEIGGGRKPKTQDERKIWNLIEALDLIETEKFEINEDNYELLIHIMFRNLGYNLDIKTEFYRSVKTKNQFKNLLNPSLIDQELKSFIGYIDNLNKDNISGFSQALVIFFSYLYISPYQQNNVIVALLISKWFLLALDNGPENDFFIPNIVYSLALHWKNFVDLTNESFAEDLDIDPISDLLLECAIDGINMRYRLNSLENWIAGDNHINQHLFVDEVDKMILLSLLGMKTDSWKAGKIMQIFKLQSHYILSRKEVFDLLDRLVDAEILTKKQKNGLETYELNNQKLIRIHTLLKG